MCMMRGSPPAAAYRPRDASGKPNEAVGDATTISLLKGKQQDQSAYASKAHQFNVISNPPPKAYPLTAAIIGFLRCVALEIPAKPPGGCLVIALCGLEPPLAKVPCSIRSCPAQKDFLPAPVIIATRNDGSESNQSKMASASQCATVPIEFMPRSRLMVTSKTCSAGYESRNDGD